MLTALEKKVIASVQEDIAVTARPYRQLAKKAGVSEQAYLRTLKNLCRRGVIRRFGATIRHQRTGFTANAMVAWKVDEDRIEAVGKKMASFRQVSHCYRRQPTAQWPYNLYTMIHAGNEDSCRKTAQKMAQAAGVNSYVLLFSRKELKKTSMVYFPSSDDH